MVTKLTPTSEAVEIDPPLNDEVCAAGERLLRIPNHALHRDYHPGHLFYTSHFVQGILRALIILS